MDVLGGLEAKIEAVQKYLERHTHIYDINEAHDLLVKAEQDLGRIASFVDTVRDALTS
jgi:hypothetical protein